MKNMKFIKSVLIVGSLVIATSAFADMPSTISSTGISTGEMSHTGASLPSTSSNGSLNAFAGVSTATVSQVELKAVSGAGIIGRRPVGGSWCKKSRICFSFPRR